MAAPTITNIFPDPNNGLTSATQPIRFDVTSTVGLRRVFVVVGIVDQGLLRHETAYDGAAFGNTFSSGINRIVSITDGNRYYFLRDNAWPSAPSMKIIAIDTNADTTVVDF
jgi:hypothetical protein